MLTGDLRNQIDSIWNDFWSGGVSNPLSVIEQINFTLVAILIYLVVVQYARHRQHITLILEAARAHAD